MKRLAACLASGVVVTALSCGRPGVQRVQPQMQGLPVEVDFEAVPVLNEKTVDLTIENVGKAKLSVSRVAIEGDASSVFRVTKVPDAVDPGDSQTITLAFVPPLEKDYAALLVVESDDEETPRAEVALKGKGSTRAILGLEPEALDFGRVAECSSSVKTLSLLSKGSADLIVQALGFSDGGSPVFSFVGSTRTPAVVKTTDSKGLPGKLQLTVKATVPAGTTGMVSSSIVVETTDPDRRNVAIPVTATPNRAPVPVIAPLGNGAPGVVVMLDGTGSMDPDGDGPLTYKWTLRSKPIGSTTTLDMADQAMASMKLDAQLPGSYEVQLDVTDAAGARACAPARATIVAQPAQKLLVELFWDNAVTDLDLHVLRTPTSPVAVLPDDCYYANKAPDWGVVDDLTDNPLLSRDALVGYGPELFGYVNPIDTTYRLVVQFSNDHFAANPATTATVRVYVYGVVKAEFQKRMPTRGDQWVIGDVEWPSGKITQLLGPDGGTL